jgi:transposase-like protein
MEQIICKFCGNRDTIKNGFVRSIQRYRCRVCSKNFICGDQRGTHKYDANTRNMVVRMYLNNCSFRRISAIFSWIKRAGKNSG